MRKLLSMVKNLLLREKCLDFEHLKKLCKVIHSHEKLRLLQLNLF